MKYKFILVFVLGLSLSCTKESYNLTYHLNGNLKTKTEINKEGIASGFHEEYYETGELKLKTQYNQGRLFDTVYSFYNNGNIKEKGLIQGEKKNKWWLLYDSLGRLKQKREFIIRNDSSKLNQSINYLKNGNIDYGSSWFFNVALPDTLRIGKNVGKLRYYSNLKGDDKYLKVIIENQFSDLDKKLETFSEYPDSTRFGIYAHKLGKKKVLGKIVEKIVTMVEFSQDSAALKIVEYEKYFEKEVFVIE